MKYFKTFEKYKYGVNGVGSLKNSLAALKRQNITGRYVDPETLAQGIRNEYEAITGEKYEDEVQMSMDNTIADIIGHYKLDGPDFMAAWDKVVKESVNEAVKPIKLSGNIKKDLKVVTAMAEKMVKYAKDNFNTYIPTGEKLSQLKLGGTKEKDVLKYNINHLAKAINTDLTKKYMKDFVAESVNEQYTKSLGFNVTNDNIYKLTKSLDPNGRLCKNISKGSDNVKPEFTEMQKLMEEIQRIWGEVEYIISMSNESVNEKPEEVTESYKGNFTDFKYDLEMAIDNMDISPKAIKSVKKKGNGYEVRLSSYMSDKSTWEKIGDTIGATLISFKPGSINIGIYE